MTGKSGPRIFFVDDEPKVRKIVARTLEGLGSRVSCFRCAADCLERLRRKSCDLLITDVKMPEMDGIELLIEAKKLIPWIPVLVVTGYGDIPMAVKAVKAGAVDFIEKPFDRQAFILAVESALKQTTPSDPLLGKSLTRAEVKVLHLILAGKNNREIASLLNRSKRTVEVHRSRIMRKVGADNLVSLVKRATVLGLIEPP
jgi:two-component system response regulator FixJ